MDHQRAEAGARPADAVEVAAFDDACEHVPVALLALDDAGRIRRANVAAHAQLDPLTSRELAACLGQAVAREVQERLIGSHPAPSQPWTTELIRRGGVGVRARLSLSLPSPVQPHALLAVVLDDQAERPLRRRAITQEIARTHDRSTAMQLLASGVAHEIGNPLTYMLMCLDELGRAVETNPSPEALQGLLSSTRQGAERVQDIVRGLSSYDQDHGRRELVDVNRAVRSALEMARSEMGPLVRVETSLDVVPLVRANPARLVQVLYNLLVNAANALGPRQTDPALGVETWSEGTYLCINVWDTGPGIDASIRDRIFEPFVSSRPAGTGAGLGLAVCHNYVAELKGEIDFDCEPGHGTRFTVRLPAEANAPKASAPTVSRPVADKPKPGTARLLVVEDEPEIRRGLQTMLRRFGRVDTAESAAEARALLSPDQHYDLVLCDLMMPGESGEDLYGWISTARPDLASRVAYVTGGGPQLRGSRGDPSDGPPCLLKPFRRQELFEFVRRAMARADDRAPADVA